MKTITLSEIDLLKEAGWVLLKGIDAGKANSDHFAVMVRESGGERGRDVLILCPTFLRGPLKFMKVDGNICY
jgi:hypothetical protein